MKYIILIISILFSTTVFEQTYKLSNNKSTLKWTGKAAFNAYSLSGTLKAKSGNIKIKNGKITAAKIIINMKTLDAENKDLKKHLRSKDFFEVKKYKTATFALTKPIDLKAKNPIAIGKLTIKGKTKPYSFPLSIKKVGKQYQVSGILTIDRTDFGIYYNSPNYFKGLKQKAIADEFKLKLELVFE
jgi:polyisoprenoid-binding protein YceI